MNFGPVQHLMTVFTFFGAQPAKTEATPPAEDAKPEGGELTGKFFIYTGALESDAPMTETVIDLERAPPLRTMPPRMNIEPVPGIEAITMAAIPAIA